MGRAQCELYEKISQLTVGWVTSGQLVRKGETIALLGSSGRSTGPHLHLEVHQNGIAVDPGIHFPDLKRS